MKQAIYLDYAAATSLDPRAFKAMEPYLSAEFYNPSAVYQAARKVRTVVEAARGQVASVLGVKDQEIIFTAGGTEANNIAIHGVMSQFPDGNMVVSSIEHESVLEPADNYERRLAPVTEKGVVDLAALEQLIDERTVLVSIMYANNEIGTVQPLKQIAAIIQKKRAQRSIDDGRLFTGDYPLLFHTDACQAANYLDLSVTRIGVDMMTLNGGKIYAMKQSGCLFFSKDIELGSLTQGGGQERSLRSGTENVASLVAFATMLQNVQKERKDEQQRLQQMRNDIFATLSQNIPEILLNGDIKHRLPNNLNILAPGADGERLLMELDELGLQVATGSACTASNDEPSHVLLALGLSRSEAAASIRMTLGRGVEQSDVPEIISRLTTGIQRHMQYTGSE
ncbi:MAG: cysteine desulfurase family protein [Candidatus Saccharimonadales bacterium]